MSESQHDDDTPMDDPIISDLSSAKRFSKGLCLKPVVEMFRICSILEKSEVFQKFFRGFREVLIFIFWSTFFCNVR